MSDEKTEKMNFFNRFITSIKDFEKYGILASQKTRTAIAYLAIILIIFSLVVASAFTYKFMTLIKKGTEYIKNNISEITYSDEKLSVNYRRRD